MKSDEVISCQHSVGHNDIRIDEGGSDIDRSGGRMSKGSWKVPCRGKDQDHVLKIATKMLYVNRNKNKI
jgi:hypothetical protein